MNEGGPGWADEGPPAGDADSFAQASLPCVQAAASQLLTLCQRLEPFKQLRDIEVASTQLGEAASMASTAVHWPSMVDKVVAKLQGIGSDEALGALAGERQAEMATAIRDVATLVHQCFSAPQMLDGPLDFQLLACAALDARMRDLVQQAPPELGLGALPEQQHPADTPPTWVQPALRRLAARLPELLFPASPEVESLLDGAQGNSAAERLWHAARAEHGARLLGALLSIMAQEAELPLLLRDLGRMGLAPLDLATDTSGSIADPGQPPERSPLQRKAAEVVQRLARTYRRLSRHAISVLKASDRATATARAAGLPDEHASLRVSYFDFCKAELRVLWKASVVIGLESCVRDEEMEVMQVENGCPQRLSRMGEMRRIMQELMATKAEAAAYKQRNSELEALLAASEQRYTALWASGGRPE